MITIAQRPPGSSAGHARRHRRVPPGCCAWPPAVGCSTTRWSGRTAHRPRCRCRCATERVVVVALGATRRRPGRRARLVRRAVAAVDRLGRRPRRRGGRHGPGQPARRQPRACRRRLGAGHGADHRAPGRHELHRPGQRDRDRRRRPGSAATPRRRCRCGCSTPSGRSTRPGDPLPPQVLVDGVRSILHLRRARRPGRTRGCSSTAARGGQLAGVLGSATVAPMARRAVAAAGGRVRRSAAARRRTRPAPGARSRSSAVPDPGRRRCHLPMSVVPARAPPGRRSRSRPAKKATESPQRHEASHDDDARILRALSRRAPGAAGRRLHGDQRPAADRADPARRRRAPSRSTTPSSTSTSTRRAT